MTDRQPGVPFEAGPMGARRRAVPGLLRLPPPRVDAAVAVVVFGASVVNLASQDAAGISAIPATGFVMLAIAGAALFWRRSLPLAALGVALVMTIAWTALGYPGNPVFHILVSLHAVGRYVREVRVGMAALAVALVVVGIGQVVDADAIADLVTGAVVTTLPWYVGRRLRVRAAAARERAEYLEWKRAAEAERVIADARAAIARELHDVVAHNVSLMTVQAGVARLVVDDDPGRAREAITAVEDAGRRALDELRHLLGVLRPETAAGELGPQPVLNQVHELVDRLRRTGMSISLAAEIPSELPVRVDLFAYRIVQEALTNVLKHGGAGATAHVRLVQADGHLDIEVTDTGTAPSTLPGSGQGLVGMQERALLLGGSFEAGPLPRGGFRVMARLPTRDDQGVSNR